MIQNLPDTINADVLDVFDFGSVEATKDELLADCFCEIAPIKDFLRDRHALLIGAKGAGKTAIFTLLRNKSLSFPLNEHDNAIYVNIDQNIEYAKIESLITKAIRSRINDKTTYYLFLWELYLLYRVCLKIQDYDRLGTVRSLCKNVVSLFAVEKKSPTLLQLLTNTRRTIGVRIDSSSPVAIHDFYVSAEPADAGAKGEEEPSVASLNLDNYKSEINKALHAAGIKLYLLVDGLDDFVAKDEYKVQRLIIQGLVNCSRTYSEYSNLRVKVTIRSDLYYRLDFAQLGGFDKIHSDTIELLWTDSDIRGFIAQRIAVNLMKALKLKGMRFTVEEESLYLPPPEHTLRKYERLVLWIKKRVPWFARHDDGEARTVSAKDHIYQTIIHSVFPREIVHSTDTGGLMRQELFAFLATHFDLGDAHTTPRIMLMFLQKVLETTRKYYSQNPDEKGIKKSSLGEYPLFRREHVTEAYYLLRKVLLVGLASCVTPEDWKVRCEIFFSRKGKRRTFSQATLMQVADYEREQHDEGGRFIAYLVHLGILTCRNPRERQEVRTYDLPIILQYIWNQEG